MGRFEVTTGGIGQSFLNSNKVPDIFPAPGHGLPAQVGIRLSSGGLLCGVLSCGGFSFSEFIGTLGVVVGGCAVVLLVLGMGLGLATTHVISFCEDEFPPFVSHLCFFSHIKGCHGAIYQF